MEVLERVTVPNQDLEMHLQRLATHAGGGVILSTCNRMEIYSVAEDVSIGINRLRSEEHTSELQSLVNLVCRLLLEKKNNISQHPYFHLMSA